MGFADLHMHTTISDGLATPQQLLDHVARNCDLDVIAITDHDRLEASLWAYEQRDRYPFDIVPGVEVSSAQGDVIGLWVFEPIEAELSFSETVAAIHAQGGVAMLAHPFHVYLPVVYKNLHTYAFQLNVLVESGFDLIEVHNASEIVPGGNRIARSVANRIGIPGMGNSDAHTLGSIGAGRTQFKGKTADDLRTAILSGSVQAHGRGWPLGEYMRAALTMNNRCLNKVSGEGAAAFVQQHELVR